MGQDLDLRLSKLAGLCGCVRKGSRKPRYSEEIKALVRDLAGAGVGAAALAHASGVSTSAVRNWMNDAPPDSPAASVKVLKVESGDEGPDRRRMILMVRAPDYEVAVYARERGRL